METAIVIIQVDPCSCWWSSYRAEIDLLNASGRPERRAGALGHCHESLPGSRRPTGAVVGTLQRIIMVSSLYSESALRKFVTITVYFYVWLEITV